jgi:hypothetical protein
MSRRSLTGYDNRSITGAAPAEEVYLFDAQTGRLTCASCNSSGARPHAVEYFLNGEGGQNLPLSGDELVWEHDTWLAADLPAWNNTDVAIQPYQPRYLSDSGRLFFDSFDALVAKDSNGVGDVYEYEPEGQGGCTPTSTSGGITYRPARPYEVEFAGLSQSGEEAAGCLGLISSGTSSEESALLDASEDGSDVFFLSTSRLSPLDVEGSRTVYDAHVCGAHGVPCPPPTPAAAPVCAGDACQQPAMAPTESTPGSLTFQGAGNVVECPKGKVRRNDSCVKRHQKKSNKTKHHKKKSKHKKSSRKDEHKRAGSNRGGRK